MVGGDTPVILRPFVPPDDYESVVQVVNQAAPEFPFTVAAYQQNDANRPAHFGFSRLVAEINGEMVGVGQFDQRADMFHPHRFLMTLHIRPDCQEKNLDAALYDALITDLHRRGVESVRGFAREDRPAEERFWQQRGYTESLRDGGAFLPVAEFEPVDWAEAEARPAKNDDVRLQSYAELNRDTGRDRKLHALFNAILADVPPLGERTPVDFETFVRLRLKRIGFLPDALFVAVAPGGDFVGVHQLLVPPSGHADVLATGLTGVLPDWRRKGIALALKVRGLRYAREKGGIRLVKTWNASNNVPVLNLNERLAFVREAWRIHFVKTFE